MYLKAIFPTKLRVAVNRSHITDGAQIHIKKHADSIAIRVFLKLNDVISLL
jgi:hypothetical protein